MTISNFHTWTLYFQIFLKSGVNQDFNEICTIALPHPLSKLTKVFSKRSEQPLYRSCVAKVSKTLKIGEYWCRNITMWNSFVYANYD